jgi:chemotaxis protein MotB
MRSLVAPGLLALVVVTGPLVASGCVTTGTYEALQAQHEDAQKRLADARLDLATANHTLVDVEARDKTLQEALDVEKKNSATLNDKRVALEASLATATADLKRTSAELKSTQGELADVVKDKSKLKGSVDDMQKALDELQKRKAEADHRVAEYQSLLARFKTLIDAGKLKVKIIDGRMVVLLNSDILFPSGSATLNASAKGSLTEIAHVLAQLPDRKFQIEGHTDNVPIHSAAFPSNWELAAARAISVVKTVIDAGLPNDRVSAASFGDSKPTASNESIEGRTQNRRIEIVVVPDLSSLPGFDELSHAGG